MAFAFVFSINALVLFEFAWRFGSAARSYIHLPMVASLCLDGDLESATSAACTHKIKTAKHQVISDEHHPVHSLNMIKALTNRPLPWHARRAV